MKKRILYVEQNVDGTIGGSHYCLLYLIEGLDRQKYDPVTIFYENNPLVDKFSKQGDTIVMAVIKYQHRGPVIIRKILNLMILLIFILRCYLFLKRKKIDLVHLNACRNSLYYS